MGAVDRYVPVTITRETVALTEESFGIPMILDYHTKWVQRAKLYEGADSILDGLVADGFATSSACYRAAAAMLGQTPRPDSIIVGRRAGAPVHSYVMTPLSVSVGKKYAVWINAVEYTYTADADDTATDVNAALKILIDAASITGLTVTAAGTLTLAMTAGLVLRISSYDLYTGKWTISDNTPDPSTSIADDYAAVKAENSDWYAVYSTSTSKAEAAVLSPLVSADEKVFMTDNADSANYDTGSSTDILAVNQSNSYSRTFILHHPDVGYYAGAAWLGKQLGYSPGEASAFAKRLEGVRAAPLGAAGDDAARKSAIDDKNGNFYDTVKGFNMTAYGQSGDGSVFDEIRFVDWFKSRLQTEAFSLWPNRPKVRYTIADFALLEAKLRGVFQEGIDAGGLTPDIPYVLNMPAPSDITSSEKASHAIPGVTFVGYLSGEAHGVEIRGTMTL